MLEFIALSLLLLVPLIYLVVTLARIQAGAFAAESAASEAARTAVVTGVRDSRTASRVASAMDAGATRAEAAVGVVADGLRFLPGRRVAGPRLARGPACRPAATWTPRSP